MSTLESRYKKDISSWNWNSIIQECKNNPAPDNDGNIIGYCYLGSVFSLSPSGKFYLPFACSNLESCFICGGSGLTKKLYPCEFCQGEGKRSYKSISDRTGESIESVKARLNQGDFKQLDSDYFECNICRGKGEVNHSCKICGGMGSIEAYRDSIWYDILDKIAESKGVWIESGEGDSTDIFVCLFLGEEEQEEQD